MDLDYYTMAASVRSPAPKKAVAPISVASTPPPPPRPTLTVEEWEAKAPISDLAIRSVASIKAASEKAPLPLKFTTDENTPSRPGTPNTRGKTAGTASSRPGTPLQGLSARVSSLATHALHPKQPVQTPQQFYDWFALIDRSVAHSQEAHFRAHVASVAEHLDTCDRLIQTIASVDHEVDTMLEAWRSVEEGGKNLQDACEQLLQERDRLLSITQEIDDRLSFFEELEHATRLLNHPGESLVLQPEFLSMVANVDQCIEYLKAHRHFREAEVYLLRYRQCMTRAMTLIKMYFLGSLRALSADIQKRMSEKEISRTAQMHLLYTRFTTVSSQVAPYLRELEYRARTHPDELEALLSECHSAYFSARKALLVGPLTEEMKGLDPTRTELVELTRAGCSYLKQLCTDEFNLYREFFNSGEAPLYQYLENLCDYLYDDLRPRILHEPRLTALCEVCTVLQALMVLDVAALPDALSLEEDEATVDELAIDLENPQKHHKHGLGRLHISHLLQMVLQDAQTRLFFKAQAVIQSDIRYYPVKPEDLAYPEKLIAARQPISQTEIREKESISQIFRSPSLDKKETWFPTVQKVVWVLSQLHEFVKPVIFEDIAQEAINLCRQSLLSASLNIRNRSPPTSTLDGYLFLVRHLLILKEITNKLDLVQRSEDASLNFSGVTETLASVLNKTTSLLPQTLFASLGVPRSDESIRDAKQGIDHDLREGCEDIITECSSSIYSPLRAWRVRIQSPDSHPEKTGAPEEWAGPGAIIKLNQEFNTACHRDLSTNVIRLKLYLEDERTVGVLLQHVQSRIAEEYLSFKEVAGKLVPSGLVDQLLSGTALKGLLWSVCVESSSSR